MTPGAPDATTAARYGLLRYNTLNLGDEIQSLASQQFLPTVDALIDREAMNAYCGPPVRAILNGWYMHQPWTWPPSPGIDALLISMHISRELSSQNVAAEQPDIAMLRGDGLAYFQERGPIGARDLHTMELLHSKSVDAYFSGCMTLTFPSHIGSRTDEVCCVDIDDLPFLRLVEAARFNLKRYTHCDFSSDATHRFGRASALLDRYKRARLVITSRLHCALPCLAFGTPIIFIESATDSYRFSGLRELLHVVPREAVNAHIDTWWRSEFEANKRDFVALRSALLPKVMNFIHGPASNVAVADGIAANAPSDQGAVPASQATQP